MDSLRGQIEVSPIGITASHNRCGASRSAKYIWYVGPILFMRIAAQKKGCIFSVSLTGSTIR